MPTVLPMTRVEAYLAYKAGVIAESDLKPSLKTNYYSGLEHWLAYWCGLCDDYPTKDGQPKWYTEEEYYVAYLCGIAPDYPVNCYRRVGAYLRYIISARWDRPEKPLTREEYYLSLISTTYLSPNEPASIISIDGTAEAPFGDLKIYGDTFQQTYSGKNLFDFDAFLTAAGAIYTKSGNIYSISSLGTAYSNPQPLALEDGSAYTISQLLQQQETTGLRIDILKNGSQYTSCYATDSNNLVKTFTADSSTYSIRINYSSAAYPFQFNSLMIEKSASPTAYEPYVGGIPSPSPDYPEPVNVVTGEQTVKVCGKNLFDINTLDNGTISVANGVATGTAAQFNSGFGGNTSGIMTPPTGQVTLSATAYTDANGKDEATGGLQISFRYSDGTNTATNWLNNTKTPVRKSITSGTGKIIDKITISFLTGGANIWHISDFQLELGPTATAYEPYQGHTYEINLGKNLLDKSTATTGAFLQSDGSTNPNASWAYSDYIAINGGATYITSGASTMGAGACRCYYDKSKTFISGVRHESVNPFVDTAPANAWFMRESIPSGSLDDAQIEAGSTATTYAPYFTPIELCKIGTYQDYIWKDGADWKIHKAIGKAVLDNTSGWATANSGTANYFYYTTFGISGVEAQPNNLVSNYEQYGNIGNTGTNQGMRFITGGNIRFRSGTEMSIPDWQAKLGTTNMIVYYWLATATDTQITDAALIAQLDALLEGGSYEPQTNITLTAADPNLPGLLQVTAAKWQ